MEFERTPVGREEFHSCGEPILLSSTSRPSGEARVISMWSF